MLKTVTSLLLVIFMVSACRPVKSIPEDFAKLQPKERGTMLAVFMDGTRDRPQNKLHKNTHTKTMHSLAYANFPSLYVEGVGAKLRFKHIKHAITTDQRIMRAYRFLSTYYEAGDSICLFGFSRGANQCRILASFIYTIGIVKLDGIKNEEDKQPFLLDLYKVYATTVSVEAKRKKMAAFIREWESSHPGQSVSYDLSGNTPIELLALWDTVEALMVNDRQEIAVPIPVHLNQLYNVKKFFHALSLDDNRAFNYTPVLATHTNVELHPTQDIDSFVEEVWFNGSHRGVGGGVKNKKYNELCGVSLKWMLEKIKPYHIARDTSFKLFPLAKVNNMRSTLLLRKTSPGDTLRGIDKYWYQMNVNYHGHKITIHQSVIDRLAAGVIQPFKLKKKKGTRTDWYDWEPFSPCFRKEGDKRIFLKESCSCIEVVSE